VLLLLKQIELPCDLPYEVLYGRAGYLWACSFLNKHIDKDTIPSNHMVRHIYFNVLRCNLFCQNHANVAMKIGY
jgi:hypothetical protein